jgi:tRNA nucleotidyltransferase/poly(A) polymerase
MPQIYRVGGCVRDRLLGLESKDIDFTFVLDNVDQSVEAGFEEMKQYLLDNDYQIFLSTPSCFTIRAKFPKDHKYKGLVADFVMARKEIGYEPGTRRPILLIGTLEDDLIRRDFTVNAIAETEDGKLIDPFGGIDAIKNKILTTPISCERSFNDDPLRILRAIRFSITKGFEIPTNMSVAIFKYEYETKMNVVSTERIREELYKCLKHDTILTLDILSEYPNLKSYIFKKTNLWLKPTIES